MVTATFLKPQERLHTRVDPENRTKLNHQNLFNKIWASSGRNKTTIAWPSSTGVCHNHVCFNPKQMEFDLSIFVWWIFSCNEVITVDPVQPSPFLAGSKEMLSLATSKYYLTRDVKTVSFSAGFLQCLTTWKVFYSCAKRKLTWNSCVCLRVFLEVSGQIIQKNDEFQKKNLKTYPKKIKDFPQNVPSRCWTCSSTTNPHQFPSIRPSTSPPCRPSPLYVWVEVGVLAPWSPSPRDLSRFVSRKTWPRVFPRSRVSI